MLANSVYMIHVKTAAKPTIECNIMIRLWPRHEFAPIDTHAFRNLVVI